MELNSSSYCSSMMNHQYHHQSQPLYQNYHSPKQRCINTLEEVKSLIISLRTKKKKKEMDSAISKIDEVIQTIKVTMSDSSTPALRPIDQIILEKLEKIESKSKPSSDGSIVNNNKPVSPTTVLIKPTDESISPQQLGAKLIDLIKNDSTLKLETTTIGSNGIQLSSFHSDIKNKIENLMKEHHLDTQVDLIELKKMSPPIDLTISSKPRFEREDLYKELTKRTAERHSSLSRQSSESSSGSTSETYVDGQGRLFRTPSTTSSALTSAPPNVQHTYDSSSVVNNGGCNINTYNSLNNINIYESNQMIHLDESIYGRSKRSYPHLPPKPPSSVNVGGSSDYGLTGRISGITKDINRRVSNHDVLYSIDAPIASSSAASSVSTSQFNRAGDSKLSDLKDSINGGHHTSSSSSSSVSASAAAVSEECQQICAIFGDLSTSNATGESNLACSEGSITPTNADRSNSPTNEHSPSSLTSSTSSSTNRDPVQFSALKSTKSFPGNPIAESLYSSTGTLSRSSNKPAPPPPVRKTSSISDPNAITLGTLRNAGCSTYEEIKTLKRNVRNHSGGYNTYEELNSDRNAVYHAARKSCLSTSLTSLVEPIYSTLDSNTISISNPFNSKIVTINTSSHRLSRRDEPCSKSYSASTDHNQHSTASSASRPPSSSNISHYMSSSSLMKQRSDDDSLPPPPPEAYIDSSSDNHHNAHNSHNRIVLTRREFLQTLNAKLSVPQNQRVSPKLVKRRSMSLPHSDQEWDSDSGITTQSSSSGESGSLGSSHQSESFTQSLVNQLTWWSKF